MRSLKEFSAGGLVIKDGKILLTLMRNLKDGVWTYPKGHVEKGETPQEAALREVFEETGYKCEICGSKEIYISRYSFNRNGAYTEKEVYWYEMKPVSQCEGIQTPQEIIKTAWVSPEEAEKMLFYKSDFEMLKLANERIGGKNGF
ncbi:MAG: NUDIX domain-containing protein [Elusimicrobiota bacterium]